MLADSNRFVDRPAVIGAVGDHAADRSLHRREQCWDHGDIARILAGQDMRHDLAGRCIDGQMQLALLLGHAAVLLGIPLALPEHLQAGAVEHDMNGPVVLCSTRLPSRESTAATA